MAIPFFEPFEGFQPQAKPHSLGICNGLALKPGKSDRFKTDVMWYAQGRDALPLHPL
jgi:hypothetical protein